mmetsp:Transcript_3899/g.8179  ORF Transcript_3899/g.8179 Transcript_3899/m.8179 type:complete len:289 (-) Transcript_3899:2012-2878(-)
MSVVQGGADFQPEHLFRFGRTSLYKTTIKTGSTSTLPLLHTKSQRIFEYSGESLCQVLDNELLITGGHKSSQVWKLLVNQDFAAVEEPSMHRERMYHSSVLHGGFVYVVAGRSGDGSKYLKKCERLNLQEGSWESIADPMQLGCNCSTAIALQASVYVLGGHAGMEKLNTVQKLSLDSLQWELLDIRLPYQRDDIACFYKSPDSSQIYFIQDLSLYTLDTETCKIEKTNSLSRSLVSNGPTYFRNGTLFLSTYETPTLWLQLEEVITIEPVRLSFTAFPRLCAYYPSD